MVRKVFALTLALALALTLLPATVLAEEAENSGAWGDNVTWTLAENEDTLEDGGKGLTLTLAGDGRMADCEDKADATPWAGNGAITRVVLDTGITNVPEYLCGNGHGGALPGLSSVTIPESVEEIGAGAFYGCTALDQIELPDSVTTVDASAFWTYSAPGQTLDRKSVV